jgi:hypothetical protein
MKLRLNTLFAIMGLTVGLASAQAGDLKIENETLVVKWSARSHQLSVRDRFSGKDFLQNVTLNGPGGMAILTNATSKTFGAGQAIEIGYPDGNCDTVRLFPHLPFALFCSSLHNGGATVAVTRSVCPFSGTVNLGRPAAQLETLGTGGLLAPDQNPGSYAWLAVGEPRSRNGAVFGWLTDERGSGVLFSQVNDQVVRVDGQIDYGRLTRAPGKSTELETLAVGFFNDARLGLEAWADAVAKVEEIHLPPEPVVYCTWYSRPYGEASDEKHFAENAAFLATNLAPFGFSVAQIDEGWEAGVSSNTFAGGPPRDFTQSNPNGPYPHGMEDMAARVKSLGLMPGLWFEPFAGTSYDPHFAAHQDWFVKREDGKPYEATWGGTCFDLTEPGARAYVSNLVRRITHDWGYEYIKTDGLWTGTATPLEWVNSGYTNDHIGDAVFHDPDVPNIQAYRSGLKLVREAAGTSVFILGCASPQNMRSYRPAMGLVDAMRIGPDSDATWKEMLYAPTFGSRQYFLNGRVWHNDPDAFYVRDSVPLNEARALCSWVTISGAMNTSSEWYPGLSPARLDLLRRTMPSHGLLSVRPADLFEHDPPRIWLLSDTRRAPRRDVIGLFNWSDQELQFDDSLAHIGLDANTKYVAFGYWRNELLPPFKGRLKISVPPRTSCVLAVRPVAHHPQLISTSRHITQGIVDVLAENWDAKTKTMSGCSQVVGGNDYELRIVSRTAPATLTVSQADKAAGVKTSFNQEGRLLRVKIESPVSRDVSWSAEFK